MAQGPESKLDRGAWVDPAAGRIGFADHADTWMAGRIVKPKTRAGYRSLLDSRILPTFGKVPLNMITPDAVRTWVADMEAEGCRRLGSNRPAEGNHLGPMLSFKGPGR